VISTTDKYGPVTIVIPSGSMTRYVTFELDMETLNVPVKSTMGRARSSSPAKNRNEVIRLSHTPWYAFFDDDQHVDEETLLKLLAHNKPVVCALVCSKMPPFIPILFKGERTTQEGRRQWHPYSWRDLDGHRGLFGPVFAGNGGVFLVKREVFETIPEPWFKLGQYDPEDCQEDLYFYEQCRNYNIPVYCDLSTRAGHISPVSAAPTQFPDGTWSIRLQFENDEEVLMNRTDLASPQAGTPA
jgi:hypothetical protein